MSTVAALDPPITTTAALCHAFTVDVEDWFQGIPIADDLKASGERRLEHGMHALLDLMDAHRVRGTFFLLGPLVKEYRSLFERVAAGGHEIGCHGWSHDLVYEMDPSRFREETRRAVDAIASVTGAPVTAYRAAYFSVTRASFWALEVLAELGFRYDSSIFPVRNWRYGISDFPQTPQRIQTAAGPIYELPISVRTWMGRTWPVSGGAYFRIYPYAVTRANMRAMEAIGRTTVFYLHPWELDPGHPRVPFHWKARWTHYHNLRSTYPKLRRLLSDFRFGTLGQVLDNELADPST
jgi:polysaccharide deacetylase family protein (PEP-CTERM system associated)